MIRRGRLGWGSKGMGSMRGQTWVTSSPDTTFDGNMTTASVSMILHLFYVFAAQLSYVKACFAMF